MKTFIIFIMAISFLAGQSPKYTSFYLTDEVRSSIKMLIKYNDIADEIENQDDKVEYFKAVSEAFYISTNKLDAIYSKKVEEKNNEVYEIEVNLQVEPSTINSDFTRPTLSYEYKPIKITSKAKDKNIHEKQAKKMKIQYIKLHSYFKEINDALDTRLSELELLEIEANSKNENEIVEVPKPVVESQNQSIIEPEINQPIIEDENMVEELSPDPITIPVEDVEVEQELADSTVINDEIPIQEVDVNIKEVDNVVDVISTPSFCNIKLQLAEGNTNKLHVVYDCSESIYGFQFELTNLHLNYGVNPNFDIRFSERTGQIIGFSFKGDSMPIGKGLLAEFGFISPQEDIEVCLIDEVIAGMGGSQINIQKVECLPIFGSGITVAVEPDVELEEKPKELEVENPKQEIIVEEIIISDFKTAFRNARNSGADTFELDGIVYSTLTRKDFRRAFRKARAQGKSTFRFGKRTYSTKIKEEN